MTADAPNRGSLLLLFFSDGAPSDQAHMQCEHGVPVFQVDRKAEPLMQHKSAASAWTCRSRVHDRVKTECLSRVRKIGDVFGKEKVVLRTLAFGRMRASNCSRRWRPPCREAPSRSLG